MKVMSKKLGDKEYSKYIINLPKELVEGSKLLGKNLKAKMDKEKIILERE